MLQQVLRATTEILSLQTLKEFQELLRHTCHSHLRWCQPLLLLTVVARSNTIKQQLLKWGYRIPQDHIREPVHLMGEALASHNNTMGLSLKTQAWWVSRVDQLLSLAINNPVLKRHSNRVQLQEASRTIMVASIELVELEVFHSLKCLRYLLLLLTWRASKILKE